MIAQGQRNCPGPTPQRQRVLPVALPMFHSKTARGAVVLQRPHPGAPSLCPCYYNFVSATVQHPLHVLSAIVCGPFTFDFGRLTLGDLPFTARLFCRLQSQYLQPLPLHHHKEIWCSRSLVAKEEGQPRPASPSEPPLVQTLVPLHQTPSPSPFKLSSIQNVPPNNSDSTGGRRGTCMPR